VKVVIPPDVPIPTDPIARAAFEVLEKHCSRCHQVGMLNRERPAKNFGNILQLGQIAADPHLIQPGNPEGSKLFQQLLNKEMPYDIYYEFDSSKPAVTAEDMAAVSAWIKSTGDQEAAACAGRKFVTSEDVVNAIAADLQAEPDHRVKNMRYFTLANVYNSCATDEAMNVYRQGLVKLLNGFGRRSDVVRLITIDPAKVIVAVNLDDLGWTEADWNTVLAAYPYAVQPDVKMFDFVTQATGTILPYVRADWFTFTAAQPPLYDTLLQLPTNYQGLTKKLGVDLEGNIKNYIAQRAGFQKSGVSRNNRMIERHPISTGYFWTSYDFATSEGQQSLFQHPLGPGGPNGFVQAGGESIFSLPNGFQAYYLAKADGESLNKGPPNIVQDPSARDFSVTNGISCMGCHDQGMRKATDAIRKAISADHSFNKDDRETVKALYPEVEAMNGMIEDDFQRFGAAMKRAGLDPTLKLGGVEMTNALSKRYEDDVSLRRAAAEYGFDADSFKEHFIDAGPEAIALLHRLEQGIVPRDQFEGLYTKFVEGSTEDRLLDLSSLKGATKVAAPVTPPVPGGAFQLVLTADKTDYSVNDTAVFSASATRDCSLFIVNVAANGDGTIIFPNKFQTDNAIHAGQVVQLGAEHFRFRLKDPGHEKVVAVCKVNGSTRSINGYTIDPSKQTFAVIKDFEKNRFREIGVEGAETQKEAAGLDDYQREQEKAAKIAAVTGAPPPSGSPEHVKETVASTAIIIQVQ